MNARITGAAIAVLGLWVAPAFAQNEHAEHAADQASGKAAPAMSMKNMPPDEEGAKQRLNTSPRHGEWTKVSVNGTPVSMWVVYPQRPTKAPVTVVIQEIFGLSDWIRAVADQLAADGFIAVAPDLLSGHGPNGGDSSAFASRDDMTKATGQLSQDEIMARLDAAREYGIKLPAANGKSATVGFCFGGTTSFAYAVHQPALNATVVYYGTAPKDLSTLQLVKAPVLGLYGGNDARVDATIPDTDAKMRELKKTYQHQVFDGAGHGFLRAQTGQDGANMKATMQAWAKTIAFLRQYTNGAAAKSQ